MRSPVMMAAANRAAPFSMSRKAEGGGIKPRSVGFRKFSASSSANTTRGHDAAEDFRQFKRCAMASAVRVSSSRASQRWPLAERATLRKGFASSQSLNADDARVARHMAIFFDSAMALRIEGSSVSWVISVNCAVARLSSSCWACHAARCFRSRFSRRPESWQSRPRHRACRAIAAPHRSRPHGPFAAAP